MFKCANTDQQATLCTIATVRDLDAADSQSAIQRGHGPMTMASGCGNHRRFVAPPGRQHRSM